MKISGQLRRILWREPALTVNNKNIRIASGCAWNIDKVDVVLGKSHYGVIVAVGRLGHVCPREGGGVGSSQAVHIQEEEPALRDGVEDVGIVVEDGIIRSGIERAGSGRLCGPGFGGGVEDVHVGGIRFVAVDDVDGVEELRQVAGRASAVKGSTRARRRQDPARQAQNGRRATHGRPSTVASVALPIQRKTCFSDNMFQCV